MLSLQLLELPPPTNRRLVYTTTSACLHDIGSCQQCTENVLQSNLRPSGRNSSQTPAEESN